MSHFSSRTPRPVCDFSWLARNGQVPAYQDTSRTPSPEPSPISPRAQYTLKAFVYDRLLHRQLRNVPEGFPLLRGAFHRHVYTPQGPLSNEFDQVFEFCGERNVVKFNYTHCSNSSDQFHTWSVTLPKRRPSHFRHGKNCYCKFSIVIILKSNLTRPI